jgi:hypothetical protein
MNCAELAATLDGTLIRERDPQWLRDALRHAEQCPTCARLMELHQVEERLTELAVVEPGSAFLESVMERIARLEPVAVERSHGLSWGILRYPTMLVGAAMLAMAYLLPAAGGSWTSNLWPTESLVRTVALSAYFTHHTPWSALLAGASASMIILGLALAEHPIRSNASHNAILPR